MEARIESIRQNIDVVVWSTILSYLEDDPDIQYVIVVEESHDMAEVASECVGMTNEEGSMDAGRLERLCQSGTLRFILPTHPPAIGSHPWRLEQTHFRRNEQVRCLLATPGYIVQRVD